MRVLVLTACLLAGCATSRAQVVNLASAPPATHVARSERGARVRFDGNEHVSRAELLDAMRWDDPERDLLRLAAVYYDRGYARVRIDEPVVAGGVTTYRITEGARYRIGKIAALAPTTTPDGLPMMAHVHARSGDWFDRSVIARDVEAVRALYRNVGYPFADVQLDSSLDDARHTLDLTITGVDLGTRVTITRVEVLAPTIDETARARASIGIGAGALYDASTIEAARQRLLATGAWAKVEVSCGGIPATYPAPVAANAFLRFELTPR